MRVVNLIINHNTIHLKALSIIEAGYFPEANRGLTDTEPKLGLLNQRVNATAHNLSGRKGLGPIVFKVNS